MKEKPDQCIRHYLYKFVCRPTCIARCLSVTVIQKHNFEAEKLMI